MLIKFATIFPLITIKKLIKINNIKRVFKFNKSQLLTILNKHKCATFIQARLRQKIMTDETCPISLEPLKYPFVSIKINDKFNYYDFNTIIEYFNKRNDFRDPLTRVLISDKKINEMNKLIIYYYNRNTNKLLVSDNMIRGLQLNIITHCLYELISEINELTCIRLDELYYNFLPRLMYYCHVLNKKHTKEETKVILTACRENLRNCGLLLNYIDSQLFSNDC